MAAPIATFIQLPTDGANAGKKVRTQDRVVGGDTVYEHFMIPLMAEEIAGKYFFSSTQQTVLQNVQDGTTTAFFWLQMPLTGTVTAIIRRIGCDANNVGTTPFPTAPVISFTKFTFTGTASGAAVVPVKFKTAGTSAQLIVRTAVTGMTVTLVGDVGQFAIPSLVTAVGAVHAYKEVLPRNPQAFTRGFDLELGPGEGLLVYQSVAGTAADTRKFGVQIDWHEIDLS